MASGASLNRLSDSELADRFVSEMRSTYRRGRRLQDVLGTGGPMDDILREFRRRLYERAREAGPGSVVHLPLTDGRTVPLYTGCLDC